MAMIDAGRQLLPPSAAGRASALHLIKTIKHRKPDPAGNIGGEASRNKIR